MTRHKDGRRWTPAAALVAAVLLITAGFAGVAAAEQPEPPHRFFGTVENADGQAVSGVTVEVVHDGDVVASDTTDDDGFFDVRVSSEDIEEGETVTVTTGDSSESFEFESGGSTEVPLTADSDSGDDDDGDDNGGDDDTTPSTTQTTQASNGGGSPGGGDSDGDGDGDGTDDTTTSTVDDGTTATTSADPGTTDDPSTDTTSDAGTTDDQPTTDATTADQDTSETTAVTDGTTDDGSGSTIPGFDAGIALVAVLAAALLALRRE